LGEEEAGNARYAIELLWRAGKYADAENEKEVTPEQVRKAAGSIYSNVRTDEIKILDHHKKLFLLGIARRFKQTRSVHISTGEAEESYQIVCEEFNQKPRRHTQLWKYMNELDGLGVINTEASPSSRVGKTTLIGLPRIAAVDLERELNNMLKYAKRGRV
jgi:cell division control protein 6